MQRIIRLSGIAGTLFAIAMLFAVAPAEAGWRQGGGWHGYNGGYGGYRPYVYNGNRGYGYGGYRGYGGGCWSCGYGYGYGYGTGFALGVYPNYYRPYYAPRYYGYYAPHYYAPGYYAPHQYGSYGSYGGGGRIAYCQQRFRTYDVATRTYMGYDGRRHYC